MANDTAQRVLSIAIDMFNKNGYENVSLRNVAREADMALGTLTYYFKTKEDLLEAILSDLYDGFDDMLEDESRGEELLDHLLKHFTNFYGITRRYPFYFRDMNAVLNISGKQKQRDAEFQNRLYEYFTKSLNLLVQDGILRRDLSQEDLGYLAYLFINMGYSWTLSNSPYWNQRVPRYGLASSMAWLLGSYLAPEQREPYEQLCKKHKLDGKK